jgi:nucleotide-binding universal stress UspA family protein
MAIVVGFTQRPESRAALDRAAEEANLRKVPLHIIETLRESPGDNPSQVKALTERIDQLRESGTAMEARLRQQGIDAHYQLLEADADSPARQLLAFADELPADLIVIGLRRRSPVGKLVLGSVSQDILLGAECPVLAIKASKD